MYQDDDNPMAVRIECAKAAVPYLHPRLSSSSIHATGAEQTRYVISATPAGVSDGQSGAGMFDLTADEWVEKYAPKTKKENSLRF